MQEELISFKTAVLAKEKGFNLPVLNYFYNDVNNIKEYEIEDYPFRATDFNNNSEFDYSRPSQSLLQRWLREVHKLHIVIYVATDGEFTYDIIDYVKAHMSQDDLPCYDCDDDFETYEEALEEGLLKALNLSKII